MREPLGVLVGADAVHRAAEHGVLGVGAVAREEDRVVAVLDDDGELAGAVAGDGDERHVAGLGQPQAGGNGPSGTGSRSIERRFEPGGPGLVDVAAQATPQSLRVVQFGTRDEDLVVREVVQPTGVIGVEMGHHDPTDIARPDPEPLELRADLLLGLDSLAHRRRKNGDQRGK